MQISNIQENLTKTELMQRLQQIMQDAARAAQAVQTQDGDERSRVAQEQVAESQETENEAVREDGGTGGGQQQARGGGRRPKDQPEEETRPPVDPNGEGRIIDVTV